jgi:hypothetical protein
MTQAKAHPHVDRGRDLYETPVVATLALLRIERVPKLVWEPAAGRGAIVRVLEAAGPTVVSTDIETGDDFLTCERAHGAEGIVTNPPLKIAAEFAEHALKLVPYVALPLPWRFWEAGCGIRKASVARRVVLDADPPARAYCFANRLPMMHRDGWTGRRSRSAIAFGWFVWDRRSVGAANPGAAADMVIAGRSLIGGFATVKIEGPADRTGGSDFKVLGKYQHHHRGGAQWH